MADGYATGHGFTPSTSRFGGGDRCCVMLMRYVCPYVRDEHDPTLPPEDIDAFGYRRRTEVDHITDHEQEWT